MHAIISLSLYISYPIFSVVYNEERSILQTIHTLNKENPRFIIKSSFKSRAGYNGALNYVT